MSFNNSYLKAAHNIQTYFKAVIDAQTYLKATTLCFALLFFSFTEATTAQTLPFSPYIKTREGLSNTTYLLKKGQPVTVAFLGGSITYNPGWRDLVCNYLKTTFPKTQFHFVSAGIPSLGSLPHAFRLQRDVLDSGRIDLLFLEAAVNDQVNGTDSITQVRALEGIIKHARKSNPYMDLIMMSFADPDKTTLLQQGKTPVSVANHELVATYYRIPSINLARAVSDKLANKEFDWNKDFVDLHPSPFGQQLYFTAIKALLSAELEGLDSGGSSYIKHPVKNKPLDKANFANGSYLNIKNALHGSDWKINSNWVPKDGLGTRPGFVNVPVLMSDKPNSPLTLTFKGKAIGIAIVSGSDAGIITYQVDNGPQKQIDLFTEWSNALHLPWYLLLQAGLKDGKHQLKLQLNQNSNKNSKGTSCRIVYFLLDK